MATPTDELRVKACNAIDETIYELRLLRDWLVPVPDPFADNKTDMSDQLDREQVVVGVTLVSACWEQVRVFIDCALIEDRRQHLTGNDQGGVEIGKTLP